VARKRAAPGAVAAATSSTAQNGSIREEDLGQIANSSRTVDRVVRVLETLATSRDPLRLTDVARALKMPLSSTQALLRELERQGVLLVSEGKGYSVGPRLVTLGVRIVSGLDVVSHSRPRMSQLANETGEYVYLALAQGHEISYAYRVAPSTSQNPRVDIPLGVPRLLHATAAGQLYLSFQEPEELDRILATIQLTHETSKTITDVGTLKGRIEEVRLRGYAMADGESIEGVTGVSAAIRGPDGGFAGALTISVFRDRMSMPADVAVQRLLAICKDVSKELGYAESDVRLQ
jgi:DNA-binding IclR family transcriptional regulator